ncbi:Alpha-type protein kinase domain-containing protein [Entamoeba marina]
MDMFYPSITSYSDLNGLDRIQLLESKKRLQSYVSLEESKSLTHPFKAYNQLHEYHIVDYLNTISSSGSIEETDIVIIIEGNTTQKIGLIQHKLHVLLNKFKKARIAILHYKQVEGIMICDDCQFHQNDDFDYSSLFSTFIQLQKPSKKIIIQMDYILIRLMSLKWSNPNHLVIHFAHNNFVYSPLQIQELCRCLNIQYFIFATHKFTNPIHKTVQSYISHFQQCTPQQCTHSQICFTDSSYLSLLLSNTLFDDIVQMNVKIDEIIRSYCSSNNPTTEKFGEKFKNIRTDQLKELMLSQISTTRQLKGWLVTLTDDYLKSDIIYTAFGVSTKLHVKPIQLEMEERIESFGIFKVMNKGWINNKKVAIKYSHNIALHTFDNCLGVLEMNGVCTKLLTEFMDLIGSNNSKQIKFVENALFIITDKDITEGDHNISVLRQECFTSPIVFIEEFLDGQFIRWNNNNGYVNKSTYSATLNCFSHFSYVRTRKRLIVTDVQGFKSDVGYVLIDPAIHHESCARFGLNGDNRKEFGINKFFETHTCNKVCFELGLTNTVTEEHNEDLVTYVV